MKASPFNAIPAVLAIGAALGAVGKGLSAAADAKAKKKDYGDDLTGRVIGAYASGPTGGSTKKT